MDDSISFDDLICNEAVHQVFREVALKIHSIMRYKYGYQNEEHLYKNFLVYPLQELIYGRAIRQ
jgi:hypothetical protein